MLVRMKVHVSGTRNGLRWPPVGDVVELPDSEGARLCAAGLAVPEPETAVRTATPPVDGSAVEKRAPRRQKRG